MSRQSMESRRLLAEADLLAGKRQCDIARDYGVSRITASRWAKRVKAGESLASTRASGRPRKVDYGLIRKLCAVHQGRTGAKLAEEIECATGVRYDYDHVLRLRRRLRDGP